MIKYSRLFVNLETGIYGEDDFELGNIGQKYLTSWEVEDSLYVLCIEEKSDNLILNKFFGYGKNSILKYDLNKNDAFNKIMTKTFYNIFSSENGKLKKMIGNIPASLYLTS